MIVESRLFWLAMGSHTVDWSALRAPAAGTREAEGRRERRKRATRQTLIDTATEMFLERGFDVVTVAEIAEVCDVSPTTVFNYFPTKESLVLDLPVDLLAALRAALVDPTTTPLDGMVRILAGELDNLISWLEAQGDKAWAADAVLRFEAMVRDTPALQAYHRNMLQRMSAAACEVLAERAGLDPRDPEPQIAAAALLGLWSVQVNSSCKYLDLLRSPARVRDAVTAEVHRAAHLLGTGLAGFAGNAEFDDRSSGAATDESTVCLPGTTFPPTAGPVGEPSATGTRTGDRRQRT
jgi:AcrR family transcriptional regulator